MSTARYSFVRRLTLGCTIALGLLGIAAGSAHAQLKPGEKPRLAVTKIVATDSVASQAASQGSSNVLNQILDGANGQLLNAMQQTRKFEMVSRQDLNAILKEQDLAASGMVDPSDPQTARQFSLAGVRYVATITVDNYQDITQRTELEGQFGTSEAERRTIQLQAVVKVFDTTTATLLHSTNVRLDESATDEVIPGAVQQGRKTNALMGVVTEMLARVASQTITDVILPPKIMTYRMGVITFNRTAGSGVERGQYWEVFAPGEELIDPDTGESLGSEEIHIGWAVITDAGAKFSKAEAIEDFGIGKGSLMRYRPGGLPGNIDPNMRANGSDASGGSRSAPGSFGGRPGPPSRPGSSGARGGGGSTTVGGGGPVGGGGARGSGGRAEEPMKIAIFVRNLSPDVPDAKVSVLEDQVTAAFHSGQVELISRAVVLNAVSAFADEGSNQGTGDPMNTAAERLLSDQASAKSLARNLGADGLLVASISSYTLDERKFNDPDLDVQREINFYTLDVAWNMVDGGTGGSIASGLAVARTGIQQSETLQRNYDPLNELLKDDAYKVANSVEEHIRSGMRRPAVANTGEVGITISVDLTDLSIPEIRKDGDEWVITANRYNLQPMACDVMVDGFLAGTAPGVINMTPGPHRIRIDRPMLTPVDRYIVAREGMDLVIPMQLSAEGWQVWKEQTEFFESLKDNAVLREAELIHAEAFAVFLRNSRITLDTSQLRNLSIGQPSLWVQLLNEGNE